MFPQLPAGYIAIHDRKKLGDYLVLSLRDFKPGEHVPFSDQLPLSARTQAAIDEVIAESRHHAISEPINTLPTPGDAFSPLDLPQRGEDGQTPKADTGKPKAKVKGKGKSKAAPAPEPDPTAQA